MADNARLVDVWILEGNTVYKEVPFTVVADWIQQGRLLDDDMLRWSGQNDWFRLNSKPIFAAYLPKDEPLRANDEVEAMEPVAGEITIKHKAEQEEDDPDMIPLIDITLVLLIFFIMTTTSAFTSGIFTPEALFGFTTANPQLMWIGINKDPNGELVYSLGYGDKGPDPEDQDLGSQAVLLQHLDTHLARMTDAVEVQIKADKTLDVGTVRKLAIELEGRRQVGGRPKIVQKFLGVSEKAIP
ncbi:MAG: ExbD/TolR family protein [Gemmataceae bacterium]